MKEEMDIDMSFSSPLAHLVSPTTLKPDIVTPMEIEEISVFEKAFTGE